MYLLRASTHPYSGQDMRAASGVCAQNETQRDAFSQVQVPAHVPP